MNMLRLQCPFCQGVMRERLFTEADLEQMVGLYMAHLVESHWAELEEIRAKRSQMGPVNDAWTRL